MAEYSQLDENTNGDKRQFSGPGGADDAEDSSRARPLSFSSQGRRDASLAEPLTSSSAHAKDPNDPFCVFREDLYAKLELVDESLADFLRVVHQTDTSVNNHEVKDIKKQLKRHLKNAESTLADVQATVDFVENDREKFHWIDSTELYNRKALVNTSQKRISKAKEDMNSEAVKNKFLADERATALRRAGNLAAQTESERQNSEYIVDSQAKQSLLMRQQDETLDELDVAVTRVGVMAGHIHDEIESQNKMLEEMDDDLADAEEQLGIVMGKLAKLLKTKNKCQLGLIMSLSLVAIILFLLVIYS